MFSKYRKVIFCILCVPAILICAICGWYFLLGGEAWIAYTWHGTYELPSFMEHTSDQPLYTDQQITEVLQNYSWLADHYDLEQVTADSYVIPGLKSSVTLEDWNDNIEDYPTVRP